MKTRNTPSLIEQFPEVSSQQVMELFGMVWEFFPENMFLVQHMEDDDFRVLAVNPAQAAVMKMSVADIAGCRLSELLDPEAFQRVQSRYLDCLKKAAPARYEETASIPSEGGETQVSAWSTMLVPVRDEHGDKTILFGQAQDVTPVYEAKWALERQNHELEQRVSERTRELELLNQQLSEAATLDPLTRVFNRRKLTAVGEEEFNRARRYKTELSIIILDVDEFKVFNEVHGHAYGDRVLISVIGLLRGALRKTDTLARYGGDEFVVLLPHTDAPAAAEVAEKMRRVVESGQECSISLGLTTLREADGAISVALERADAALRQAKKKGRNRLLVTP